MSGGKRTTQQQTSTSAPPGYTLENFKRVANDALDLYNKGVGGQVYTGNRVADLSGQTNNALNGLNNTAGSYNNSNLNGILNNPTSSASNLQRIASGDFVGNNTEFQNYLQNSLNNAANTINSQFSGAGRYGSGAHTGVLANKLGQISSEALANQYNKDVANNLAANSQIDQANQNQLAAANNYLTGQSNAYLNDLKGGTILDQNAQNKINAAMNLFNEQQNMPYDQLVKLLRLTQGAAGNYGTTTTTQEQQSRGGFLQALGGLIGGIQGLGASI